MNFGLLENIITNDSGIDNALAELQWSCATSIKCWENRRGRFYPQNPFTKIIPTRFISKLFSTWIQDGFLGILASCGLSQFLTSLQAFSISQPS